MLPSASISSSRAFSLVLWLSVAIWILLIFLQRTNLATSDLGRHLINGKVISESGQVFQNNLYSYTNADYPAPNHHWLFGVLVNFLHQAGGFPLITLAIALIYWCGIIGTLFLCKQLTTSWSSLTAVFLLLPVIAMRHDSRPEAFSVLGISITILVCHWLWTRHDWSAKKMSAAIVTFLLMLLWVNLHILFVLGFLVTGSYLLTAFISRSVPRIKSYLIFGILQVAAATINPLGWRTIFYPLQILRDYRYPVAENQSVLFFLRYHPNFSYYYLFLILILVSLVLVLSFKKISLRLKPIWLFSGVLILATVTINRFSAFFQIPALIILATATNYFLRQPALKKVFSKDWQTQPIKLIGFVLTTVFALTLVATTGTVKPLTPTFGVGILPQVEAAGNFFVLNKLPGPIFNNYDIGGYLIYKLFPTQKVFVDNRPEAYPGTFLTESYIAGQTSEDTWRQLEEQYHFNTIFFYRHDATDWAVPFLIRRIQDDTWIPVYVDDFSLIMIKNTVENQSLITKFQLSPSVFSIQER